MRLHEPFTFFIDRCLGRSAVPSAIRTAIELQRRRDRIVVHDDVFAQDAPDTSWLTHVRDNQLVAITGDGRVRYNEMERAALLATNAAVFIFTGQQMPGEKKGALIGGALPAVRKALRRFHVPIVGRISKGGEVHIAHAAGEDFDPAKHLK